MQSIGKGFSMIRLTEDEYRRVTGTKPPGKSVKQNKYNARRTFYGDRWYASRWEAAYAERLDVLMKAGRIRFWLRQPLIDLGPDMSYKADFEVVGIDGQVWMVDAKGKDTPRFRQIKRLWRKYARCDLLVVYRDHEEIIPGGKAQ